MIVELFTENNNGRDSDEEPRSFPMVSWVQDELVHFAKKKLLESIELQQFIGEKEIDFLQKYISFLDTANSNFNNQNELEQQFNQLSLTPPQRSEALENACTRLNGLRTQRTSLGRREQKALDSFVAPLQIRIFSTEVVSGRESSLSWSFALRKVHCILEKLGSVEQEAEEKFWFSEVLELLEKLEENEKTIMMERIVKYSESSSRVYSHLLIYILEKQERIVMAFFEKDHSIEKLVKNFNILSVMVQETNSVSFQRVIDIFSSQSNRILGQNELQVAHLEIILTKFEVIFSNSTLANSRHIFDAIFNKLEEKSGILGDAFLHTRVGQLRRPFPVDDVPLIPLITSLTSSSSSTPTTTTTSPSVPASNIRNFTVIEHSHSTSSLQTTDSDAFRRQVEESTRLEMERIAEATRRAVTEEYRAKLRLEEERRLKMEQEELQKQQERDRLAQLARQAEEQQRREQENAAQQRQAAARDARLKCTFLKNVQLIRHETSEVYNESILDKKVIGLYFSGKWCAPSLTFTPKLKNFYEQVEDDFEVVFGSWDRNECEMNWYLQNFHGDWMHFPFGSPLVEQLGNQLSVTSIPTLVIIKPSGHVITMNGRAEVENCRNASQLINDWKAQL